jgi:hypothetical protein
MMGLLKFEVFLHLLHLRFYLTKALLHTKHRHLLGRPVYLLGPRFVFFFVPVFFIIVIVTTPGEGEAECEYRQ